MDTSVSGDIPPREKLTWQFLAWVFGLGWGLPLAARLLVGPIDEISDATFLGTTWLPDLIWFLVAMFIVALPALAAWRLGRRWNLRGGPWGWNQIDSRVLWGGAAALGLIIVACVAALILRPEGWDPLWRNLWQEPYVRDVTLPGPLSLVAVTLGFTFLVTELGRLGLRRSMLLSAAISITWLIGLGLITSGFNIKVGSSDGSLAGTAAWILALAAVSGLGWLLVGAWLRIRTGSAWTVALTWWLWDAVMDIQGSPMNPTGDDMKPAGVFAVVSVTITVAGVAALMRAPAFDRWEPPQPKPHRAEDVLSQTRSH